MIRKLIKALLPAALRRQIRLLIKAVRYRKRRIAIAQAVRRGEPMRIIVGSAETWQQGWYSTQEQWLDITKASDWSNVFGGRRLLTRVVAEHVFEHLSEAECEAALANIAAYLVDGGRVRIAVPDGYHPDPEYLRYVGINGVGDMCEDHKQLLTVDTLSALLRRTGFEPVHVEGYARTGDLVTNHWSAEDGYITRSRQNPRDPNEPFVDAKTSLIVDGVKQ